jgi:hypothetical protein
MSKWTLRRCSLQFLYESDRQYGTYLGSRRIELNPTGTGTCSSPSLSGSSLTLLSSSADEEGSGVGVRVYDCTSFVHPQRIQLTRTCPDS